MKKRIPLVDQIENQINTTLSALSDSEIVYTYNILNKTQVDINKQRISWINHQSGKFNTNSEFLKLNQYIQILKNNSYLCILYDGSLVRVSYTFEKDILVGHNLLWWPAPYHYKGISLDDISPFELIDEFLHDRAWTELLNMRTPIRVDYDPSEAVVSEVHPSTHIHMQHGECRMFVDEPICFNRFMRFILKNYYPHNVFKFNQSDDIIFDEVYNDSQINYLNAGITFNE